LKAKTTSKSPVLIKIILINWAYSLEQRFVFLRNEDMKHLKVLWLALLCVALACCARRPNQEEIPQVQTIPAYHHKVIALENLYTRNIAYCYANADFTAEECALALEKQGYVQLKNVPKVTAPADFLKEGEYPTRRWRNEDKVPRW